MYKFKPLNKNKQNGKENVVSAFHEMLYYRSNIYDSAKKVYNWFEQDYLRGLFVVENGKWYYEIANYANMPSYVFQYISRYMKKVYNADYLYSHRDVYEYGCPYHQ